MIVLAVGLSGVSMAGWAVNHLDLAPPYAGISINFWYILKILYTFSINQSINYLIN